MTVSPVSDYRVLAALAHPLRRRLLDVLRVEGPCTATLLAGHSGSAVGNVSHHVRVLAERGLVVAAPELARDGRERWWRAASAALSWDTSDFAGDPAAAAAARTAEVMALDRQVALVRRWYAERDARGGDGPDDGGWNTDTFLRLSSDELQTLGEELRAVVDRWRDRPEDGTERRPVFVLARGFPAQP